MNVSDSNNPDKYPLNVLTLKMYAQLDKQDNELARKTLDDIIFLLTPAAKGYIYTQIHKPYLLEFEGEILNDLWLALWQNASRPSMRWDLSKGAIFQTWAIGILHNKIRDRLRKEKRQNRMIYMATIKDDSKGIELQIIDPDPMVLDQLISMETSETVRCAIKKMPSKYREIFMLKHIDRMKSRDIYLQTGISESTICKRLKKGEKILIDLLQNKWD
ncbi:MAG: sigma-70 family RNA polymerase sigma factor [Planctomycetes bacterium]|nr:sigma-70 family RNA polymerase sigma factor [Planctomycetota bacterium]